MSDRPLVYLLNSTTTALDPRVRETMLPLLEEDPRRGEGLLAGGRRIAAVLEEARLQVARYCGARPQEIVFTSGGTESCNLAVKGVALARAARKGGAGRLGRLLVGATEHTAVLHPARTLAKLGFEVREIPVDGTGLIDLDALASLMGEDTFLVSIAAATAETGTMQPLKRIAEIVHAGGALLHTDACLAAAGGPLDAGELGADLLSLSAHKIGGPRGAGALVVHEGVRLMPLLEGGTGEGGRRGGALYVAGIAGLGAAVGLRAATSTTVRSHVATLAAALEEGLLRLPGISLNGHPRSRLAGMINVSVAGVEGEALLLKLAASGVAASSGSACIEEAGKPSHVLLAMGVPPALARSSLLLAIGPDNTPEEIRYVIGVVPQAIDALRSIAAEHRA